MLLRRSLRAIQNCITERQARHGPRPTLTPSHPEPARALGEASGSRRTDAESPAWLQEHIVNWQIPPRTMRYLERVWRTEAFDYLKSGAPLPSRLRGVERQLREEWIKQQREASKDSARAKRPSDDAPNRPTKRAKETTSTITQESPLPNGRVPRPRRPTPTPLPPLGNVKGKYIIETELSCCKGQSQIRHVNLCAITLTPGEGNTMRGSFELGDSSTTQYKAVMFFEKRPMESSHDEVKFRWRGKKMSNKDYRESKGDYNGGGIKSLGDGEIEVRFERLQLRFDAKKGSAIGGKAQHSPGWFWNQWHDLEPEGLSILDRHDPGDMLGFL